LRVAVQDILNSTHTEEYETQVIHTLLLSLGVDAKKADAKRACVKTTKTTGSVTNTSDCKLN
jgi:hypothetical protein